MSVGELPQGWVVALFDDVIYRMSNGVGGKQSKDGIGLPVSRIETIANQNIDYERIGFIADPDKKEVENYRLNKGDILFSHINSPTHLGKTAIFKGNKELYHGINLLRIEVNEDITTPDFFNFYCVYSRLLGLFSLNAQHAVNQSSINQKKLSSFEIPLPPLAEQQQIAAKLDELLAQVDSLKNRLDAIPKILKRFRQSVLAAAVSGKLTEDWRGEESSELNTTLGEISVDIKYGTSKKCEYEQGITPVLRIPNIGDGVIKLSDLKFADFESAEFESLQLQKGDILIIRSNGSVDLVGKAALVEKNALHCLYAGYLIRLRFKLDLALPKYVLYCLQSPQLRIVIEIKAKSTSGVNNINSKELASLPIRLPSLEEQTEIVQRVEQLFTYADQIEQRVKDAQSRVNHLTQSILAKAFRGELTAEWREQNPDLISGENSAEALLARIQAERNESLKNKSNRKKTGQ